VRSDLSFGADVRVASGNVAVASSITSTELCKSIRGAGIKGRGHSGAAFLAERLWAKSITGSLGIPGFVIYYAVSVSHWHKGKGQTRRPRASALAPFSLSPKLEKDPPFEGVTSGLLEDAAHRQRPRAKTILPESRSGKSVRGIFPQDPPAGGSHLAGLSNLEQTTKNHGARRQYGPLQFVTPIRSFAPSAILLFSRISPQRDHPAKRPCCSVSLLSFREW
jgi:hypothetical protein